ncbi:tyrosine-protein phosphatase [Priestia megaterium]|uniref:tyrosine-protein phosphatase n=1 Tax=Priestia megaterium TaxID=1404 RepID=UPI00298CB2D3|nr:CpsB/CapC family capsule biosynthesis tyrosine phosphatase [Priestia megaterium]
MIDIHCHILPGVDDGAKSVEDSVAMARQAVSEGIHTIIATPHHKNGKYINEKQHIINDVEKLNERLKQEGIPLLILPGQECRIYGEMLEDYQSDSVLTLNDNNKYVFVEFPSNQIPRFSEQLLFDIQSAGLTPIIVHPERNTSIIEDPNILYNFVNKGALTQVTAASITGRFGKKIRKFSLELIDANLTHLIASDAHNILGRQFCMKEATELIQQEYGAQQLYMFFENAEAVVDGLACFKEIPERIKKKKFLGMF